MRSNFLSPLLMTAAIFASTALLNARTITVTSPDATTKAIVNIGGEITYSIEQDGEKIIAPSKISMILSDGTVWGAGAKYRGIRSTSADEMILSPFYKESQVRDHYNQSTILFGEWSLVFRAYNDGVAYRIVSHRDGEYEVKSETVEYNFLNDATATIPYVFSAGDIEHQLFQSFENTYDVLPLSKIDANRLIFLPLSVEAVGGRRITITESDLRNYPGMYVVSPMGENKMNGFFAPLRDEIEPHSGYNNLQAVVKSRHDYIAKVNGKRNFPWRATIVTRSDTALADTNMSYVLAEANVIGDTSWIKPGKVAWEWWNDWNLEGVGFKPGIDNRTYKYYIDFASRNNIEYVILDEGWSVNKVYDLMQVVPEIDIQELINYGKERNVGIILWAGYWAFDRDMENICQHYANMGVKGFKVDFMNGDDQELVYFNERSAKMCAKYKLLIDIHGTYKPASLHRTYPNILNFEGVFGLEQMKWAPTTTDHVTYSVTMPYLRMISGPVDYTQGAMENAVRSLNTITNTVESQYYPNFSKPMSQGTRCHQLAQYVVFLSPINMLCDTPTNYEKNPVSTAFIAEVPTVWDETKTIEGEMGEYIIMARRQGETWYIGGLTNWTAREINIDVKTITGKSGTATIYEDGANANKNGIDFTKRDEVVNSNIKIRMAPGGGFVIKI